MIIQRISAKKVLGAFDYEISFLEENETDSRMAVIYAENGCGKTNLLKAVKALLTLSSNSGTLNSDSFEILRKVPIENLRIDFERSSMFDSDEVGSNKRERHLGKIELVRKSLDYDEFKIVLELNEKKYDVNISARDLDISFHRTVQGERSKLQELMVELQKLGAEGRTLYLGDNRISSRYNEFDGYTRRIASLKPRDEDRSGPMHDLLNRVERALNQASLASYSKDSRESNVYARVARSVMDGAGETKKNSSQIREELESELHQLIDKAKPMEKYDLISTSQLIVLDGIIRGARANAREFKSLQLVMKPYFESTRKQIASLESAQRLIDTFIETVNSFLKRKEMRYSSRSGIEMFDLNDKEIDPDYLSSGEKHLLYLLSHALLAGSVGGVLLVDEPEISLGIDWQRGLMRALLECSGAADKNVQFIVASHSLQVMTSVGRERIVAPEEVGQE